MEQTINIDSLNLNEKITLEKRKRNQVYFALDYLKSHKNKFDFFSSDFLQLLKITKDLTKSFNQKKLSTDLLLFSFFNLDNEIITIFKKFNINFEDFLKYISYGYEIEYRKKNKFFEFEKQIKMIFPKNITVNNNLEFNFELKNIIEKSIDNACRFKTPVLTPEIFLFTILEDKNNSASHILKLFLKNEMEWNLFRYEILKKIHNQETKIQGNIFQNARYFAYLLKTQLSDLQFEKLLRKEDLTKVVLTYRDLVIHKLLTLDLFAELEQEIKYSIKVTNTRNYKT